MWIFEPLTSPSLGLSKPSEVQTKSKDEIDLRTTISAYADDNELGRRLRKLHKAQIEMKIE